MPGEITAKELKTRMDGGEEFVLLDVRDGPEYERERLPGAVHMLISDMNDKTLKGFDRAVEIVTYSEDYRCPASRIAAEKLEEAGFSAINYQGSFEDWKEHGYPTEKGA
ncbi:MAG: hypothetical protein D6733_01010 [Methanobacteriota archaeon]|nr:MAG: hypothetical protein D6733_01010 [Euryarchaeota archaeon]